MAMNSVWADDQPLCNLRIAETPGHEPEHLSLARAQPIERVGIRVAQRGGRSRDAEERRDRAQNGIAVTVPGQVGITRQHHELGSR